MRFQPSSPGARRFPEKAFVVIFVLVFVFEVRALGRCVFSTCLADLQNRLLGAYIAAQFVCSPTRTLTRFYVFI